MERNLVALDLNRLTDATVSLVRYADEATVAGRIEEAGNECLVIRIANDLLVHDDEEFYLTFETEGVGFEVDVRVVCVDRVEVILPMVAAPFNPDQVQVLTIDEVSLRTRLTSGIRKARPVAIEYVTMNEAAVLKKGYGAIDVVVCHGTDEGVTLFSPLDLQPDDKVILRLTKEDFEVPLTSQKCKPSTEHDGMFRIDFAIDIEDRVLASRWRTFVLTAKGKHH